MSDDIKPFPGKEIRKQIIRKINPKIPKSRSKNAKGYIYLNGIEVTKVKKFWGQANSTHSTIKNLGRTNFIPQHIVFGLLHLFVMISKRNNFDFIAAGINKQGTILPV
jgi:hypothetical protein